MREITIKLYTYDELSNAAKVAARDWLWRTDGQSDYDRDEMPVDWAEARIRELEAEFTEDGESPPGEWDGKGCTICLPARG
jgi:hypothetical protein